MNFVEIKSAKKDDVTCKMKTDGVSGEIKIGMKETIPKVNIFILIQESRRYFIWNFLRT